MSEVTNIPNESVPQEEAKKQSKTDLFKEHLQAIIKNSLGIKVSKETAWNVFKDVINGTVEFTYNQEDLKLPLAGVGNFEVLKTEPRKSKAGLKEVEVEKDGKMVKELVKDETLTVWPFVPRFRFYPSVAVDRVVENHFGLGDHKDLEVKHFGIYAPAPVEEPKAEKKPAKKAAKTEKAPKAEKKAEAKAEAAPTANTAADMDVNIEDI